MLVLTKLYLNLPAFTQTIIFITGAIQSTQIVLLFLIKVIYNIYALIYKSKDLEVIN